MSTPSPTTVLVTGGSGFIGSYVILALLSAGYTVRTTVRSLSREASVRSSLTNGGATASDLARLSFVAASLDHDDGWAEAVQGCTYVHHVASPFPAELPKHEDDLIIPAREGTLRVLKAAAAAGVKRVVLTSSFGAVEYGHAPRKVAFTEEDWTVLDDSNVKVAPYMKSKTIAERAAWAFITSDANSGKMELVVVIPLMVSGPVLGKDISTSVQVIKKLMDGSMPGCPNLHFTFVDVRDVASLHLLAMTKSDAASQRFLAANSDPAISMLQIGKIIKAKRPQNAKKVPSIQIPNFVVHALAFFDKPIRQILLDLGKVSQASNQKAREAFGWQPRGTEVSVLDTADSLVKYGLV
jgi:nucleoside-diphosphate-sugar epimerase